MFIRGARVGEKDRTIRRFSEKNEMQELWGKWGKIEPSKKAQPTENASHSRRIKSGQPLDVDYREKIPAVRY